MSTIQVKITASPELSDILVAELGEIQFNIFEDADTGVIAYCPELEFSEEALKEIMSRYGLKTFETNRQACQHSQRHSAFQLLKDVRRRQEWIVHA